ncbi:MAG: DUF2585 family protein [Promethearchaeota archaeon]
MIIIATNKEEISKAAIDVFSFCHMFFGFILYLVTISIIITLFGIALHLICLGCIIFYSIFWELLENFLLIKVDLKFGKRKDSIINSFMDLCFFSLGGVISMFNLIFGFTLFLITILTLLTGLIIIFYVYAKKILKII